MGTLLKKMIKKNFIVARQDFGRSLESGPLPESAFRVEAGSGR